jgi:cytochrome c
MREERQSCERVAAFWTLGALISLVAFGILFFRLKPAFGQADIENGKAVYTQKCASCHTLDPAPAHGANGPTLLGVAGRPAGSVEGWDFSQALRDSKIMWTEENLNKWLTDPEALCRERRCL